MEAGYANVFLAGGADRQARNIDDQANPATLMGDKLLELGRLSKHWRGKNYTQTILPFICVVLREHKFNSLRKGTIWSVILDESTDITFNKNLYLLSKTRSETTFIGIVSLMMDEG